jgi:hypothetical protein
MCVLNFKNTITLFILLINFVFIFRFILLCEAIVFVCRKANPKVHLKISCGCGQKKK